MHSNVTIKNISWPHFSWATLYICVTGLQNDVRLSISSLNTTIPSNISSMLQTYIIRHFTAMMFAVKLHLICEKLTLSWNP